MSGSHCSLMPSLPSPTTACFLRPPEDTCQPQKARPKHCTHAADERFWCQSQHHSEVWKFPNNKLIKTIKRPKFPSPVCSKYSTPQGTTDVPRRLNAFTAASFASAFSRQRRPWRCRNTFQRAAAKKFLSHAPLLSLSSLVTDLVVKLKLQIFSKKTQLWRVGVCQETAVTRNTQREDSGTRREAQGRVQQLLPQGSQGKRGRGHMNSMTSGWTHVETQGK